MLGKHELPVAKQSDSTKLKVCVQKAVVKQLNSPLCQDSCRLSFS